jgi:hypothetical protein
MPNVDLFSPYTQEQAAIDRRRKMAELLQQQSMQPMDTNQTAGGWVIPTSPFASLAKLLQGYSAGAGMNAADAQQNALGQKYKTASDTALAQAFAAGSGSPERAPIQDPQELQQQADQGSPAPPNIPAQAPDMARMAQLLSGSPNPQHEALGLQMAQQDMQRKALVSALQGGSQPSAATGQPQTGGTPTGSAGQAPSPQLGQSQSVGGPAGGVPMAAWIQADPTGAKYMEQLAKDDAAKRTLTRFSPGGGVVNQAGQVVASAPFESGRMTTYGPGGPTQGLVPGSLEAQTATGATPLEKVQNADQTFSYVPKSQLAGAAGSPTNNPGNLRPQGASTGFQQFGSPEEGLAAIDRNLQSYGKQGVNTLSGIITKWAPPTENNTAAYITDASKRLGVDPNQPLNMGDARVRQAVGTAIILHEQGPKNLFAQAQTTGTGVNQPTGGGLGTAPRFGQTQAEQIQQARQTAGGTAMDQAFAKDYPAFMQGGAQDATKQLAQLQDVTRQLSTPGASLTGPVLGRVPDAVKSFTNPNAIAMRERVEEVVQRSLRAILGAQFTENEGTRLIARAYNQSQPEAENAIRVGRLFTQLNQSLQQKMAAAQYFEKNGTLQGWQGKLPNISDFDAAVSGSQSSSGRVGGANRRATDAPNVLQAADAILAGK